MATTDWEDQTAASFTIKIAGVPFMLNQRRIYRHPPIGEWDLGTSYSNFVNSSWSFTAGTPEEAKEKACDLILKYFKKKAVSVADDLRIAQEIIKSLSPEIPHV